MESVRSKLRRTLLPLLISVLLSALLCEGLLRAFTTPHFENMRLADGTKVFLPLPGTRVFSTEGLYEGGGPVALRVTDGRFIHPGYERQNEKSAIFLGGSTTEGAMLDEGERWSDRLGEQAGFYPLNYGRSGNTVFRTGPVLDVVLDRYAPDASYVFLMHAINDVSEFSKTTRPASLPVWDGDDRRGGQMLKSSYLISLLGVAVNNLRSKRILPFYLSERQDNDAIPQPLDDARFREMLESAELANFLEERESGYRRIIERSRRAGMPLILLTQPASYRSDFEPFGTDVRVFPVFHERRLSVAQTDTLMHVFNAHTRQVAQEHHVLLIDVEKFVDEMESSPLFYDGCHYTPVGAERIASFIAGELKALGIP